MTTYLAHFRPKGRGFSHALENYDFVQLSREETVVLMEKLRQGIATQEEENLFKEAHLKFAFDIVGKYVLKVGDSRSDDLVSAAFEGICLGTEAIKKGAKESGALDAGYPDRYLALYMNRAIAEELASWNLIGGSLSTQQRRREEGIEEPEVVPMHLEIAVECDSETNLRLQELKDFMFRLCDQASPRRKEVIALAMEGFDDLDIAHKLGITRQRVHQHRRALEKAWCDHKAMERETQKVIDRRGR